jgi:hypothetical protein
MRQTAIRPLLLFVALAAGTGFSSTARANKLDLSLGNFTDCDSQGNCWAMVSQFEQFMAEYSMAVAPKLLASAETLGYSGFYMGLGGTLTPRPSGDGANERWNRGTTSNELVDVTFNPGVHIRKGLPWSLEIGSSVSYLAQSELVGLGGEVKWSLFEGYRHGFRGPLPDVAVRASVTRILGESDVDMTIIGLDGSISYNFGIGGMVRLIPYMGFQYLWTIVRVEPLTYREDFVGSNPVFHEEQNGKWDANGLSGPNLGRKRLFAGFQFGYEVLVFSLELDWGLPEEWKAADEYGTKTKVGHQIQISGGVGIDF